VQDPASGSASAEAWRQDDGVGSAVEFWEGDLRQLAHRRAVLRLT